MHENIIRETQLYNLNNKSRYSQRGAKNIFCISENRVAIDAR